MIGDLSRGALGAWIGLRTRWRGLALPVFASPLLPAALFAGMGGDERIVTGSALGFGASLLAARILRRGRQGDANRAAWIMAVGTGLAAHLAADMGGVLPLPDGRWRAVRHPADVPGTARGRAATATAATAAGTRAAPAGRAEPRPPGADRGGGHRLADPRLRGVADAMEGVLDNLAAHPDRLPQARRFLAVHLDGLERITARLEAGAAPPEGLPGARIDAHRRGTAAAADA